MTVELITGTPGSGKTTFAVAERIAKEVGRKVTLDDESCLKLGYEPGHVVERRIVAAGVRGLKIPHERLPHLLTKDATSAADVQRWNAMVQEKDEATGKMIDSDTPVHQRLAGEPAKDVEAIVQNWWLWCQPGDLIVIDEAQFVMPRGTLGRKPPFWIQAFEIHRHYGVDVLVITQHPQLIDTVVRALVGLHRHVRSVMGSPLCMVYVWDHASNPERYNLANKTTFIRRAKHYALFHSSVAHVKPPTSGRSIMIIVPLLLLGVFFGFQHFKERFQPAPETVPPATSSDVVGGKTAVQRATAPQPGSAAEIAASFAPRIAARPETAPAYDHLRKVQSMPLIQGGYMQGEVVACYTNQGMRARISEADCRAWLSDPPFDPYRAADRAVAPVATAPAAPSPVQALKGS